MRRFIFSFENPGSPDQAVITLSSANELLAEVVGLRSTESRGCYIGKEEPSICVCIADNGEADKVEHFLQHLCALRGQDCIMVVGKGSEAHLLGCCSGSRSYLGKLREVPEAEARAEQAWTEIAGVFYVARR